MTGIFWLDLDLYKINGYEKTRVGTNGESLYAASDKVIEHLIDGIISGADFPPVILDLDEELDTFRLSFCYNRHINLSDGGHARTIAHYIEGKPLKVRIRTEEDHVVWPVPTPKFCPISQYLILDDILFAEKGIGLERRKEIWSLEHK